MPEYGDYDQSLSRQHPGLFVILLDQSDSMTEKDVTTGETKSRIVTTHVNTIIQKMIEFAQVEEFSGRRKNYAYVSILGYNDNVYPLISNDLTPISLPDLDDMAQGNLPIQRKVVDKSGRAVRSSPDKIKFWIKPQEKGNTDMARAFETAETVIRNWLHSAPEFAGRDIGMQMPRSESFPPVLINITDAKNNGKDDPEEVVQRIRELHTNHGNVLIYNCHFTHEGAEPCVFPRDITEVRNKTRTRLAERMFYMSSELPERLRAKAQRTMRIPIEAGARCFVYNASPDILLKFLTWTTLGNRR